MKPTVMTSCDRLFQAREAETPEQFNDVAVGDRGSLVFCSKDRMYLYNAGNQMTRGRLFGYVYDNNGNQGNPHPHQ